MNEPFGPIDTLFQCPARFIMECPNLKPRDGDMDMNYEHYDCAVCGRHVKLDYEEMR